MSSKSLSLVNWGFAPGLVLIAAVAASAQSTATIDFGTTAQTIRGFGGATAWMPALTSAQANALFATGNNQVGLTIHRMRIDDSSTTGGESNWGAELSSAQSAAALGAINIASPWGAPAAWKSNNSTVQGSLLPAHYADYANYLESFVTFLKSNGVNLYAISMQNEPDANVTYDSMVWTPAEMDTWVANNSSVLTTKLMMPESESFTTSFSDATLDDANAVGQVAIVAGHIYGTSPSFQSNAESKGKEVWMTEHYLTPSGAQPAIGDALAAAEEIHNSMVTGQYNAYVWWWAIDWNPGTGCCTNYGLIDTNSNPTYYGLALAQFSRFVRPGFVRVSATANPNSNVLVSAYKGPSNSVIVAINSGGSAVNQPFSIENQTVSAVAPFQTTSSEQVAQLSNVAVSNNAFTFTLPAQSITTFVTSGSGSSCTTIPSAPSSASASAASSSSILLDWSSVADPSGCTVGYNVFRSTTGGFTPSSSNQVANGLTGTSFTDTGLAASTTYFYKVEAVDGAGSSPASPQASATTQSSGGSCTAVPSVPSTVTASAASSSSISLSWGPAAAPSGCTVAYNVFRSTTSGFTPSSNNQVASSLTGSSFTDTGLAASTTYFYKVEAVDSAGSSAASAQASATTQSSGGGSGFACHVTYNIFSQWPGGFTAGLNIENTGTTNISSWTLTWTFANGQTVSSLWNGSVSESGANVTVNNLSYNGSIPAGTTYSGLGFNGTWNNSTNAVPASFTINGTICN